MTSTMAFKVFLSYSLDPSEESLAWRLQTLAASHGVEMYVPRRGSPPSRQKALNSEAMNAIHRADCVLAIITEKADQVVEGELKHALALQKVVLPIVSQALANNRLLSQFPRVFTFSPADNPGKLETEVVEFLKRQELSKEKQQAMGALVAVGVGLLLLFSLSEK
jgi:nucleoside 2-deoxyribosyltransferase